jgi:hypothetical protein
LVYTTNIFCICSLSGFRGQHHNRPDSAAQDIYPVNDRPDPNDLQDFELPDQQTLIDAFLRGLCKESECEFCGLSHLLASLPDPSQILEDMLDGNEPAAGESESRQVAMDQEKIQQALTGDRNFSIACELGVRYPVLKAMLSRDNLHIRTSPLLSLHSMSAELRTFLGGCHCFRAFLTETQHLLFHTSMLLDRSRPLHSAVLTDQARDLAGAAMFTRSTPGCGTLADPSLESQGFRSQKPKGSAERPDLIRPCVLRGPGRPGRLQRKKYDKYIPGIYQSCVPAQ